MELENTFTVPVPVDEAWRVLLDIERIAPCLPGAALDTGRRGRLHRPGEGQARPDRPDLPGQGVVHREGRGRAQGRHRRARQGPARQRHRGRRRHRDARPPRAPITRVDVLTDLNITGRPAQFGRGVMTDVGNKLLGQFADKLAAQLGEGDAQGDAARAVRAPRKVAATAAGAVEEVAASAEQAAGDGDGREEGRRRDQEDCGGRHREGGSARSAAREEGCGEGAPHRAKKAAPRRPRR